MHKEQHSSGGGVAAPLPELLQKAMKEKELAERIKDTLFRNRVQGYSRLLGEHFDYIKPAERRYPFQYFWDSCIHVYILCSLQEYDTAKQQLRSLFQMQEPNGFVGHAIFWQKILPQKLKDVLQSNPKLPAIRPKMSALIQPPMAAEAALKIYRGDQDDAFLREILPKLKNYFDWLAENRDFEGRGLLSIISTFESGADYKPTLDSLLGLPHMKADWRWFVATRWVDFRNFVHRYDLPKIYKSNHFIAKDALFNTLYALDLKALAELCRTAGDTAAASRYSKRARKVSESIMELMFDKQTYAFYDLAGHDNRQIKILTPTAIAPIVLEEVDAKLSQRVVERHLHNKTEFATRYPLPSVALNDPAFDPYESRYLWRGPTWIIHNWFLYRCLKKKDFAQLAREMKKTTRELIDTSGFREYYNPFTGEGYGAHNFTWSGLILDME